MNPLLRLGGFVSFMVSVILLTKGVDNFPENKIVSLKVRENINGRFAINDMSPESILFTNSIPGNIHNIFNYLLSVYFNK